MGSCNVSIVAFQTEPIAEIIRLVKEIESLGYGQAWVGDSQMIWREAFVTLGALAVSTRHIRMGVGVTNPLTRHVAVQAGAWSSLAELTGGRAVLGMGLGDSAVETLGLKPARMQRLEQSIATIRRLVRGEAVELDGHEVRLTHAYGRDIPVYVAASGPRMLELTGRIADGAIMLVGVHPEMIEASYRRIAAGCAAAGRSLDQIDTVAWVPFCINKDGSVARDMVRPHVARAVLHPMPFELSAEDQAALDEIRRHYDYYAHLDHGAPQGRVVPDRFVEMFAIAGTPEECLVQTRRLAATGVKQIALIPHGPGRLDQVRLFAQEVLRHL